MKKLLLLIGILITVDTFSQQDPQLSQYMFSKLAFNPGYAGSNEGICGSLLYRNQWAGFAGAPKTTVFNIESTVRPLHGGLGLSVMNDQIGAENIVSAKISYAYRTNFGSGMLGIGIESGVIQKRLDVSKLVAGTSGDAQIPTTSPSSIVPDLGLGFYYKNETLFLGVSSSHILESELDYITTKLKIARHYYVLAGYDYKLPNPDFVLKPSLLIKSDATETQFDFINLSLMYKDFVWGGVTYRLQDAVVPMAGVMYKNFKIGYSYDITLSNIGKYSSGSHEVMVGYCYPLAKKTFREIYRNVLFL